MYFRHFAVLLIIWLGGLGTRVVCGQARERHIETIPTGESLRRSPPRRVARLPAWHELDQSVEVSRELRKRWGLPYTDIANHYNWLASPTASESKTLEEHLKHLERGLNEAPESPAGRVVMAKALLHHAWEARGSDVASTVTEEGWRLFHERAARAHRLLDEAIALGVKDGEAYARLVNVGYAEGHSRDQVQAWVDAGMKLDPTYYAIYDEMAVYLLPRWMGQPGDIERFAADVASKVSGDNGLEAYARIALSTQNYECGWGETLFRGEYDPKMLVRGAEVLLKRNPGSSVAGHFAALCSLVAQDHEAAKRVRPYVGEYKAEDKVWAWQNSLNHFREWSSATECPKGGERWVFAGLMGTPGIAFGNESQHVWVAQQLGRSAANLMDTRSGSVDLALPSPGGVVNGFVFDAGRKWAVLSAWQGPLTGWMFWDLSGAHPPITHETKEQCQSLAIHPKRPLIFWSEGQAVRSWDVAADAAGTEIKIAEHVHTLFLSADGSLMAANHWIYDTVTGTLKFRLGMPAPGQPLKIRIGNILAIDEGGQVWATVVSAAPKDPRASLVRFSPDGATWETVLDDIGWDRAWLSPDRKLLATAPAIANGTSVSRIDVWNIAAQKRVKQFDGHWNSIQQLVFSPDGNNLASVELWADAVKIWPLAGLADEEGGRRE
jgi:hypothetical protein